MSFESVTTDDFMMFRTSYYAGACGSQRFGQAFMNKFKVICSHYKGGKCLFYEPHADTAEEIIWSYFIRDKRSTKRTDGSYQ